jgi:hypothetical protein
MCRLPSLPLIDPPVITPYRSYPRYAVTTESARMPNRLLWSITSRHDRPFRRLDAAACFMNRLSTSFCIISRQSEITFSIFNSADRFQCSASAKFGSPIASKPRNFPPTPFALSLSRQSGKPAGASLRPDPSIALFAFITRIALATKLQAPKRH